MSKRTTSGLGVAAIPPPIDDKYLEERESRVDSDLDASIWPDSGSGDQEEGVIDLTEPMGEGRSEDAEDTAPEAQGAAVETEKTGPSIKLEKRTAPKKKPSAKTQTFDALAQLGKKPPTEKSRMTITLPRVVHQTMKDVVQRQEIETGHPQNAAQGLTLKDILASAVEAISEWRIEDVNESAQRHIEVLSGLSNGSESPVRFEVSPASSKAFSQIIVDVQTHPHGNPSFKKWQLLSLAVLDECERRK